jgi:hypothetical protein
MKEFISYLKSKESCRKDRAKNAKVFANTLKEARKNGDTKKLESIFGQPGGS